MWRSSRQSRLSRLLRLADPFPARASRAGPGVHCRRVHTSGTDPLPGYRWPATPDLTPYEVLNQSSSGSYSRGEYFKLVKLFHPDRPCNGHPACKGISAAERLRRYHLIVAAHEILSDPVKRSAFDKFGDNWWARPELFGNDAKKWAAKHSPGQAGAPGESWRRSGGTWEDRYHQRAGHASSAAGADDSTVVSPQRLRSFILTIVAVIGLTQVFNVAVWSQNESKVKEYNLRNMQFLEQRKRNTLVEAVSHDDRVKNFLAARDPVGVGLKDEEQPIYKQLVNPQGNMLSIKDVDKMEQIRSATEASAPAKK
ncbi:hypothetical protein KEM52_006248 [Ascosphaera acerosa]|nr:hypothetical protein KEM52_006248 [Ascosphaera acerosa]